MDLTTNGRDLMTTSLLDIQAFGCLEVYGFVCMFHVSLFLSRVYSHVPRFQRPDDYLYYLSFYTVYRLPIFSFLLSWTRFYRLIKATHIFTRSKYRTMPM
ncbi:hypothetical protein BDV27DRAFT_126134 [Aspergillus caelatus]|uniref:Very-long-chain (3R)-3-hydroxyacyl-CoA dehydratase n=1 Tax=Aspergillus caelatus TaxID=61420 RepID=A0A5N7A9P3_9EURO|nr:uncharacterized protein BDV27DRAFT_126134 [Aspergillus caelatus]KAE8365849.1 hypothetical protein BDV27DRAFT_126134 [Aspergillus caelatus]